MAQGGHAEEDMAQGGHAEEDMAQGGHAEQKTALFFGVSNFLAVLGVPF